MSWSVKASGTRDNVKAIIDQEQHMPPLVKGMIKEQVDLLHLDPGWTGDPKLYQVMVESWGHIDNSQLDVNVKVTRVPFALKAPDTTPSA